ncbi:MAG: hypothetical protein L0Z53_00265 [Acidobacteriales bacterium]|nr:hypothetical protein [Terriglobales bacterium]
MNRRSLLAAVLAAPFVALLPKKTPPLLLKGSSRSGKTLPPGTISFYPKYISARKAERIFALKPGTLN